MDKITALKLALDGKKVRNTNWNKSDYVYYCYANGCFYNQDEYIKNPNNLPNDDDWKEYKPEPKFKVGEIVYYDSRARYVRVVKVGHDGKYSISFDQDDYPDFTGIKESELEPA